MTAEKSTSPWIALLVGVVLIAAPLFSNLLPMADYLLWWHRSASFVEVQAQVDTARWVVQGKKSQHCLEVAYRYAWEGQTFRNNRLGLEAPTYCFPEPENSENPRYTRIIRAQEAGGPIAIWVDPARPSDAVIDREISWGKILPGLAINSGVLIAGLFAFIGALAGLVTPPD